MWFLLQKDFKGTRKVRMKRGWPLKVGGMAKAITAIIPGMDGLRITICLMILRFSPQQEYLGES
jgi:hypothetical protein